MGSHKIQSQLFVVIVCIILVSAACNIFQKQITEEDAFIPVCTPPACKENEKYYCPGECPGGCGTTCITTDNGYYGCAFTVNVPDELSTEDISWNAVFTPILGGPGWVAVHARKIPGTDVESAFEQAASQYGLKNPFENSVVESVTVIDYLDKPLQGLRTDFIIGNNHTQLMVIVRPDTMLGDLDPTEVIYEIVAQAPENIWNKWKPIFDVIFQSFQPLDCGGV